MTSSAEALENAIRLLREAEVETDRQLAERLNCLADSWLTVAELSLEREKV